MLNNASTLCSKIHSSYSFLEGLCFFCQLPVINLVFYAQSTSTVMSGRWLSGSKQLGVLRPVNQYRYIRAMSVTNQVTNLDVSRFSFLSSCSPCCRSVTGTSRGYLPIFGIPSLSVRKKKNKHASRDLVCHFFRDVRFSSSFNPHQDNTG